MNVACPQRPLLALWAECEAALRHSLALVQLSVAQCNSPTVRATLHSGALASSPGL